MSELEPSVPGTSDRTNRILLVDADGDCQPLVRQVAEGLDCDLMLARTSPEAFPLLRSCMHNLNLVVVDVDPGAHGLALLEAISACAQRPPIVVISALEETYMRPIAAEHGASACLGKPLTLEKLDSAMHAVAQNCLTCDRWGSLIPSTPDKEVDVRRCFRGIAEKLSPITSSCHCAADEKLSPA